MSRLMQQRTIALTLLALCAFTPRARAWELFRSEAARSSASNEHLAKGQHKEALEPTTRLARELPNDPAVQIDRGLVRCSVSASSATRARPFVVPALGQCAQGVRGPALYNWASRSCAPPSRPARPRIWTAPRSCSKRLWTHSPLAARAANTATPPEPRGRQAAAGRHAARSKSSRKKEQDEQDRKRTRTLTQTNPDKQKGAAIKIGRAQAEDQQNDGGTPRTSARRRWGRPVRSPKTRPDGGAPEQQATAGGWRCSARAARAEQPHSRRPRSRRKGRTASCPSTCSGRSTRSRPAKKTSRSAGQAARRARERAGSTRMVMQRIALTALAFVLLALSARAQAQGTSVSMSESSNRVAVGEPFAIEVSIQQAGDEPDEGRAPDFGTSGALRSTSRRSRSVFVFSSGVIARSQVRDHLQLHSRCVRRSRVAHTIRRRS